MGEANGVAGGCRCGASRYTLAVAAMPPVYCCHCRYCQTWSGSAFTQQAVVAESAIAASGPIITFERENDSGHRSTQRVCGSCHTRLWNTNDARPGIAVVRAGTLDDSETLVPRAHIWVSRKQPWVVLADGVPTWPETPPIAEFFAVMQA